MNVIYVSGSTSTPRIKILKIGKKNFFYSFIVFFGFQVSLPDHPPPLPPPTFKNDLPGPSSYIQSINE